MILNLFRRKQLFFITLPTKINGQFWLNDIDNDGFSRPFISIEAVDGQWLAKSNKIVTLLNDNSEPIQSAVIHPYNFYYLKVLGDNEDSLLYSEKITLDRQTLSKFTVTESCTLTIGRSVSSNIHYNNKYISSIHAVLSWDGKLWTISDSNSVNGTFVNRYKITESQLNPGDLVYIMGLKFTIGMNFIALNNPDNLVQVTSDVLKPYTPQIYKGYQEQDFMNINQYFYRSPRFKRDFEKEVIEIDPPPPTQKYDEVPLALMLGPSMTMGLAFASTGLLSLYTVTNNNGDITQALPTIVMSFSMLLGTILWPILTKRYERKKKIKNEKIRQQKYLDYLNTIRDDIKRASKHQKDILYENLPSKEECESRIIERKSNLWERIPYHTDFLKLKLGIGNQVLFCDLKIPEKKFAIEDDNLLNALLALRDEPKYITDVPISISLVDKYLTGIVGARSDVLSLTRNLILQAVALHSYDELKIVTIVDNNELEQWEFTKWLPHSWDNEKKIRYFASTIDEVKELSVIIENNILNKRDDHDKFEYGKYSIYYLFIVANVNLSLKCNSFNRLLTCKNNIGYSVIALCEDMRNLPKEVTCVVEVNNRESKVYDTNNISGKSRLFVADTYDLESIIRVSHAISNIPLNIADARFTFPKTYTLLEMFNISKIEHLNSFMRWKENNPTLSLQTPIGINNDGEPFILDLHEKFHGPHGLIAGMTGSGKSEFIITFILSLAINYHPHEVAFILIDYKGGGLAGAFEDTERGIKLPHLAGTITNLDGASVQRSLISIQSELRRRQLIFNNARKLSNEGTMDIYKYQQLYRNKTVTEPIPHLFIIADEFAELKTQQPEFMEQLISAARIGRSLGIHLILATQKPSGIVDDQIWSNSKFRVCLKVQEKSDSMDVIKSPIAAEISQIGRFYLQVGYNEFFAQGQSAWSGAKYIPTDTVEKSSNTNIQVVDNTGRIIKEMELENKASYLSTNTKQVVAAVKYLSDLAKDESISVRQLWQEPIAPLIYIDDLKAKYSYVPVELVLNPIVGEYDDPFNQNKGLLTLPLTMNGNCIIYGATGSGKTAFLTTLMFSLIRNHNASALNIYALDFEAETLKMFKKAPQVGDILTSSDYEAILNLFKMIEDEISIRKKLLSEYGGDYISYIRDSKKKTPSILIIINNYANFIEAFEDLSERFNILSRDCLRYGIYFVITSSSLTAIRYTTLQNFSQILTMQLNDKTDYSVVMGKTDGLIPSKYNGRGLVNLDNNIYEFQTATVVDAENISQFIRGYCDTLNKNSASYARPVPILPEIVNSDTFSNESVSINSIPVGISKHDFIPVRIDLSSSYLFPVLSQESYNYKSFIIELINTLSKIKSIKLIIIDAEQLLGIKDNKNRKLIANNFEKAVNDLFDNLVLRNNTYKDAKMDVSSLNHFETKIVVIIGVNSLINQLSENYKEKFELLLEKGNSIYKVHIILVDTSSNISEYSFDTWYKKSFSESDGIWIGNGFSDQEIMKPIKMLSEYYININDKLGYVLSNNKPTLTRLITYESQKDVV